MQTFSKLVIGISLATAALGAPKPGLDINIHLGDYSASSGGGEVQPQREVALLTFDEFKFEEFLKPDSVGNLKWEGPWMMFNGENVHLPGVVSKPNAVFIENPHDPTAIEAIEGVSPWRTFGIESFLVTRLFEPRIWPLPPLTASLICKTPWGKEETHTQVRPVTAPGMPIKFDNWQPTFCTKIEFRIGYPDEEGGVAFPAQFAMDNLSIVWYTPDDQCQHDQLKA